MSAPFVSTNFSTWAMSTAQVSILFRMTAICSRLRTRGWTHIMWTRLSTSSIEPRIRPTAKACMTRFSTSQTARRVASAMSSNDNRRSVAGRRNVISIRHSSAILRRIGNSCAARSACVYNAVKSISNVINFQPFYIAGWVLGRASARKKNDHYHQHHYYYFWLMAIFRWTCVSRLPLASFSTCSGREPLGIRTTGYFTGQLSFLPPNHRCQSTEENKALTLTTDLGSSFHPPLVTPQGRVVPRFMPSFRHQYQIWLH